jgi:hypothetical protein
MRWNVRVRLSSSEKISSSLPQELVIRDTLYGLGLWHIVGGNVHRRNKFRVGLFRGKLELGRRRSVKWTSKFAKQKYAFDSRVLTEVRPSSYLRQDQGYLSALSR